MLESGLRLLWHIRSNPPDFPSVSSRMATGVTATRQPNSLHLSFVLKSKHGRGIIEFQEVSSGLLRVELWSHDLWNLKRFTCAGAIEHVLKRDNRPDNQCIPYHVSRQLRRKSCKSGNPIIQTTIQCCQSSVSLGGFSILSEGSLKGWLPWTTVCPLAFWL